MPLLQPNITGETPLQLLLWIKHHLVDLLYQGWFDERGSCVIYPSMFALFGLYDAILQLIYTNNVKQTTREPNQAVEDEVQSNEQGRKLQMACSGNEWWVHDIMENINNKKTSQ